MLDLTAGAVPASPPAAQSALPATAPRLVGPPPLVAKSLKCSVSLPADQVMRIKIHGDNQRQKMLIRVAGRTVTAWLTLRALRKARAAIDEHGVENVVCRVEGWLNSKDVPLDAGLQTQPKGSPSVPVV
jgi:hypothetical protein